ncbi:glycosyltransferase family 4 protein [Pseudotamlana carrageenivorans]|uniref:Glycosyl transferase family 1 n=1 Tax=Pseudotamlana carrageenivorans TaxID=2069432 RepID=A0A2I7SH46_9FLAO|nr:glycosyltransferase family 4 protein [Tamlana carrageenivorans]AUS05223.1 glycosyl transferase family 1 [Tamlana carrageenivorans]
MRKALIHDWYYINGGAEKVLKSFNTIWGDFEHYALIDFLNKKDRNDIFIGNNISVKTSFIQNLPTAKSNHRKFLQWFPYAVEQFDLKEYDLVLSSSASIAKGVLTNQNQLHICYCHSPMRYAWDLYHQYLKESNLKGLKGIYAKYVLHKMRTWDVVSSNRVDYFIANSKYIAKRIKKIYNRESVVIYPPVDVNNFKLVDKKEDYYFTASRMVPYKKIELIVRAFNKMPDKKLIVSGDGPEFNKIKKIAKPNIELLGFIKSEVLKTYLENAKAFVFAAEEDFGIIPVEAQACGTPVIAFGKGGVLETVINKKTGVFFYEQEEESIIKALKDFETLSFNYYDIRAHAKRFSKERFEEEIKTFVLAKYKDFKGF